MKALGIVVAVLVIIALGFAAWLVLIPGPMAFASGSTVALADYKAASPTGVPAQLAQADLIKRGEYLVHAADCVACHTAPGAAPYAGGFAFNLPGSARSIPPTSRPTSRPASAITPTRSFWRR